MPGAKVRVVGLGNVLMGDDAAGPWVVHELVTNWEFPEEVEIVDVGTPGLDLVPYLADADTVLIVDTVKADGPPGRIHVYEREKLLSRPARPRLSPHDPGLSETLFTLTLAGSAPRDVALVGIVPSIVDTQIGLSPPVRASVPRAAAVLIEQLSRRGFPPRQRRGAPETAPWWEEPAGDRVIASS